MGFAPEICFSIDYGLGTIISDKTVSFTHEGL
jgi:hypothetical protein